MNFVHLSLSLSLESENYYCYYHCSLLKYILNGTCFAFADTISYYEYEEQCVLCWQIFSRFYFNRKRVICARRHDINQNLVQWTYFRFSIIIYLLKYYTMQYHQYITIVLICFGLYCYSISLAMNEEFIKCFLLCLNDVFQCFGLLS